MNKLPVKILKQIQFYFSFHFTSTEFAPCAMHPNQRPSAGCKFEYLMSQYYWGKHTNILLTCCFLVISLAMTLAESKTWMAVSSSRISPSDDSKVSKIFFSISCRFFLLAADWIMRAFLSSSKSGLMKKTTKTKISQCSSCTDCKRSPWKLLPLPIGSYLWIFFSVLRRFMVFNIYLYWWV